MFVASCWLFVVVCLSVDCRLCGLLFVVWWCLMISVVRSVLFSLLLLCGRCLSLLCVLSFCAAVRWLLFVVCV